jgi:hypothetical protein
VKNELENISFRLGRTPSAHSRKLNFSGAKVGDYSSGKQDLLVYVHGRRTFAAIFRKRRYADFLFENFPDCRRPFAEAAGAPRTLPRPHEA